MPTLEILVAKLPGVKAYASFASHSLKVEFDRRTCALPPWQSVQPSTTLSWALPVGEAAGNLAGYKVYWRLTTEPQWTWSRDVGRVG